MNHATQHKIKNKITKKNEILAVINYHIFVLYSRRSLQDVATDVVLVIMDHDCFHVKVFDPCHMKS
jgi:hypothetical protein